MNGDHSWGMGWGFPFFGPVFWILIVIGIVYFVRWLVSGKEDGVQESLLDILKRRYARGEIDRDTFERMKKEIEP
ncbi:MAG TPA: SHOCT domain-containing protein [Gammaproteobacteria bacterium]|nr:SHOCT domain-containing protein [Gammaproteobacteria bacterium]